MVLVEGGTFKMGTDDPNARDEWKPARDVTVNDFFMDINEVTNEDYHRFVKEKGYKPPPHWKDGEFPAGESKLPVYNVSWYDAKAYAEWAEKRLPREAEWEYAARGKDNRIYPWGNEWSGKLSNSREDGRGTPVAVGSYRGGASFKGIVDLAGNVSEWVEDDYAPYPGSKAKPDPGFKVYRGGSYRHDKSESVTYARWTDYPDAKFNYIGFRCAKDVPK
jgi:formylglycine-generating enzyme required for sulfatase activity